jgi:hypothetical protein
MTQQSYRDKRRESGGLVLLSREGITIYGIFQHMSMTGNISLTVGFLAIIFMSD